MTGPFEADQASWIGKSLTDLGGPAAILPPHPTTWYRFGDAFLEMGGDDDGFLARFRDVHRECTVRPPPPSDGHRHACLVRRCGTDRVHVGFRDAAGGGVSAPDPLDYLGPILRDRGYDEAPTPLSGWRLYRSARSRARVAFSRTEMVLERRGLWAWIAANAAVGRVFAAQPEQLFLHGAAMGINGRGVLMLGPTGAGKTTVALALAARGHSFLSDEIAAVRLASKELIPVRRSPFVRPGPAAAAVDQAMSASAIPDSARRAVSVETLFPDAAAAPVAARYAVVLRRFGTATRLERFVPGHKHLRALGPLASTMIAGRPAGRVIQMLSLLSQLECYFLDAASPDDAADAIERLVEG